MEKACLWIWYKESDSEQAFFVYLPTQLSLFLQEAAKLLVSLL
jgi:hypothetical protein